MRDIEIRIQNMLEDIKPEQDFENSEDYIEDGLLDSFDVISLVDMIEEEFGVLIDGLDIVPENFVSIKAIIELIDRSGGEK